MRDMDMVNPRPKMPSSALPPEVPGPPGGASEEAPAGLSDAGENEEEEDEEQSDAGAVPASLTHAWATSRSTGRERRAGAWSMRRCVV